jgi:NAD(P) transhydrogenase subunit beta
MIVPDVYRTMGAHYMIDACGIAASYVLMVALWRMSVTHTAAYGIRIAGAAMLMAVLAGCLYVVGAENAALPHWPVNAALAAAALALGGGTAWWRARKAAMSALPQLTVLFNGMGAAAAAAIASLELFAHRAHAPADLVMASTAAWLAAISSTAAWVAWAKLRGILRSPVQVSGRSALAAALLLAAVALGVNIVRTVSGDAAPFLPLFGLAGSFFGCALLCALLVTLPIDALYIPVAASMINAVTGVSVALVGIVLRMPALTVVGMLVGGAGLRLAQLRARSASRTVIAALLGDVGQLSRESRSLDAGDAAVSMNYARKVIVVPGYGLAAAQGQHKLHELMKLLMSAGVEVKVALHPMAGRMPGQMGVILADAHVPDGLILPSADVEDGFRSADLVLVVGASDAVNPSADTIKTLPMFGIPSLDAGMARQIYVIKRGAGAGYSGIANPAFDGDNCHCIYGDAQTVLIKMIDALRVAQIPAAA